MILEKISRPSLTFRFCSVARAGLVAIWFVSIASPASADEAQAVKIFRAMSNYLAALETISFAYDSSLELVTENNQKIELASSGTVTLVRPDKIRATRRGGFANVEFIFDGKTVSLLGKDANVYALIDAPGTIDQLVDTLRDKYQLPAPAADLLMSDVHGELMPLITDVMDLGSGVIRDVECDHLAFRTEEADFQIWIARGEQPYPCRYSITTTSVPGWPQYTIDVRDWHTGGAVSAADFRFAPPDGARQLTLDELGGLNELPPNFVPKGDK